MMRVVVVVPDEPALELVAAPTVSDTRSESHESRDVDFPPMAAWCAAEVGGRSNLCVGRVCAGGGWVGVGWAWGSGALGRKGP